MAVGVDNLLSVTEETLVDYVAYLRKRNVTYNSIKRYLTGLHSFYKFLLWKKYIPFNPVTPIQQDYLKTYKSHSQRKQVITVDQAKKLVASILDPRERCIVVLLLKTGIRNHELTELDVDDVDFDNLTIHLKPTGKRSNLDVFFDDETSSVLKRWLKVREKKTEGAFPPYS